MVKLAIVNRMSRLGGNSTGESIHNHIPLLDTYLLVRSLLIKIVHAPQNEVKAR